MTKLQIRMRQVDQVKDFVDLLSKYPYEMDLSLIHICCTYRYRLWILAGCVRVAHPVFVLPYFPLFRSSFFVAHRL